MRKTYTEINRTIFLLQFCAFLFFCGSIIPRSQFLTHGAILNYLMFPAVYMVLFFLARWIAAEYEYIKPRTYCIVGIIPLAFMASVFVDELSAYLNGRRANNMSSWLALGLLILNLFAAVLYFKCAIEAKNDT